MKKESTEKAKVKINLTRDTFNSLITTLSYYSSADKNNSYTLLAEKIIQTILRYGRPFIYNEEENVMVTLYENEATMLIKLLAIYCNAIEEKGKDYYSQLSKIK